MFRDFASLEELAAFQMGRFPLIRKKAPVVSAPPTGVTYDTSMGTAVDTNGFASLPLRSGARYIYVGNGGSDGASGLSHAARLATTTAAWAMVTAGQGDQILVAEGSTFAETIPWLAAKSGFSAQYPTVFQSYNPADPTNTAQFGRPDARGAARPIMTGSQGQVGNGGPYRYFAFKGIDFAPTIIQGNGFGWIGNFDYILYENCILRNLGISANNTVGPTNSVKFIFRNSSQYGGGPGTGIFMDGVNPVIEDAVQWHTGWLLTANRDDPLASGGLGPNDEGTYLHTNYFTPGYGPGNSSAIVRRTLIADGPGDSGTYRGHTEFDYNVVLDCPVAIALGGGDSYNVKAPNGVLVKARYNACIGSQGTTTVAPRGTGIISQNGANGSEWAYNILARGQTSSPNQSMLSITAFYGMPSYAWVHHNVWDGWVTPNEALDGSWWRVPNPDGVSIVHQTVENNYWDLATSGTNQNISALTRPNRYTPDTLAQAYGFANKTALMTYAVNNPTSQIARALRSTVFTGYGMGAYA